MIKVYKDGDYITVGTNKGVYLIACDRVLAFKPSPKQGDIYSMYIDKRVYDSFTQCSNEHVNKCIDYISHFCGRTPTNIVTRVINGEFSVKDLQNMF